MYRLRVAGTWRLMIPGKRLMNGQVDIAKQKVASRETEVQLSLIVVLKKMYLFLCQKRTEDSFYFRSFPKNCCFHATFFAAIALERLGYGPVSWILAHRESTGSHVWGECEDLVFDLTSGQYLDNISEYLIYHKDISTDVYHNSFIIGERGFFDDRFKHDKLYFELCLQVDRFLSLMKTDSRFFKITAPIL
jgi:hypothetical protein